MLLFHPTILGLFASLLLILFRKRPPLFLSIALLYPIIATIVIYLAKDSYVVPIGSIELVAEFSDNNCLIGYCFLFILLIVSLYNFGHERYYEIILGQTYCVLSLLGLFAGDFISLLMSLEIMLIASSLIIALGDNENSFNASKKYFITHLISSNFIVIAIAHIYYIDGSFALQTLTPLLDNNNYSNLLINLAFIGCIINVASFPFTGWLVNCYPHSTPSGFLYLISFTSKLSVVILLKLFPGHNLLYPFGVFTIVYSLQAAWRENQLLKILCHLSVIQIGLMLFAIADDTPEAASLLIVFLMIHIIYKAMLSMNVVHLINEKNISQCSNLARIKNPLIVTGLLVGIICMLGLPFSASYFYKRQLSDYADNNIVYAAIILASFANIVLVPWRSYLQSSKIENAIKLNFYSSISYILLLVASIFAIFCCYYQGIAPLFGIIPGEVFSIDIDVAKQLLLFALAGIVTYLFNPRRKTYEAFNIIDNAGKLVLRFALYSRARTEKKQRLVPIWQTAKSAIGQSLDFLSHKHDQQVAIFSVFIFLLLLFLTVLLV